MLSYFFNHMIKVFFYLSLDSSDPNEIIISTNEIKFKLSYLKKKMKFCFYLIFCLGFQNILER